MTKLKWDECDEIATALLERHPNQNPLKLSFTKLHRMIVELPEFASDPEELNERTLETIQMTWYEQKVGQ